MALRSREANSGAFDIALAISPATAKRLVERVDQNDAEFAEELDHHPAESVGEIRARLVRIAKVFDETRHELRLGQRGHHLVDVLGYLFVQFDVAYGLAFFGRTPGVSDSDELAFAVDEV